MRRVARPIRPPRASFTTRWSRSRVPGADPPCRSHPSAARSNGVTNSAILVVKIATWNVNRIRARETQLCDWLERDQPDVVCLQELKVEPGQIPARCSLADYYVFWHGRRAYSGGSLHFRKSLTDGEPQFSHPEFDAESRIG